MGNFFGVLALSFLGLNVVNSVFAFDGQKVCCLESKKTFSPYNVRKMGFASEGRGGLMITFYSSFTFLEKEQRSFSCTPSCCEFRQEIKGEYLKNGKELPLNWSPGLSTDRFVEDGGEQGSYGHPQRHQASINQYSEDRKSFSMKDDVNIPGLIGDEIEVNIVMRQKIIDTCNESNVVYLEDKVINEAYEIGASHIALMD